MSIGGTGGLPSSAAGSSLQQRVGTEADRRAKEASDGARQEASNLKAEKAAGIGATEEDTETSDRDADGRKLWEAQQAAEAEEGKAVPGEPKPPRKSKATNDTSGGALDLTG